MSTLLPEVSLAARNPSERFYVEIHEPDKSLVSFFHQKKKPTDSMQLSFLPCRFEEKAYHKNVWVLSLLGEACRQRETPMKVMILLMDHLEEKNQGQYPIHFRAEWSTDPCERINRNTLEQQKQRANIDKYF